MVELVNRPLNGIEIYKKTDEDKPLEGVEFTVKKENNLIGTYKTSASGLIQIPDLEPGFYTVFESKGVDGYTPDARPQTVELNMGDLVKFYVRGIHDGVPTGAILKVLKRKFHSEF